MDAFTTFAGLAGQYESCFLFETLADNPLLQPRRQYIGVAPEKILTSPAEVGSALAESSSNSGRLVGFMSHEAIQQLEPSLSFTYKRLFPDCLYGLYPDGLIFEANQPGRYFTAGEDRHQLYEPQVSNPNELSIAYESAFHDQKTYEAMLFKAKQDIVAGRIFQVVLANKYEYRFTGDLLQLYARLREVNPSSFMFFIKFGDIITMGASPELLSFTGQNGRTSIEALAGTIRRGTNPVEDAALAKQLSADEKELAEHRMLVDLVRNDIGRVSKFGSVHIDELMYIKKLSHVQHLCSLVSGELAADKTMFDALAACFPTGTLTGTPKIEAMKLIQELEASERGPWGGGVGYFDVNGAFDGAAMHAVNIRSVSAAGERLSMHSGSGIVYDSEPGREYQEIAAKKAAMDRAMEPFMKAQV